MRLCFCCSNYKNKINSIDISIIKNFPLKNIFNIFFCSDCNFYFSDSDNNQTDYDNYYKLFSKYKTQKIIQTIRIILIIIKDKTKAKN